MAGDWMEDLYSCALEGVKMLKTEFGYSKGHAGRLVDKAVSHYIHVGFEELKQLRKNMMRTLRRWARRELGDGVPVHLPGPQSLFSEEPL